MANIPDIQPHPDFLDRVTIGGVTFHIDAALITAKRIYDACLIQMERDREARQASRQIRDDLNKLGVPSVEIEKHAVPKPDTQPEAVNSPTPKAGRKATG